MRLARQYGDPLLRIRGVPASEQQPASVSGGIKAARIGRREAGWTSLAAPKDRAYDARKVEREISAAVWLPGERSPARSACRARLGAVRLDERAGRADRSKKGATFDGLGQPSGRPRPRIFSRIPEVGWSSFGLGMSLPPSRSVASPPHPSRDLALGPSEGSCQGPPPSPPPAAAVSPPRADRGGTRER